MRKFWKYFILVALLGALMCTAAFAADEVTDPTFTDTAAGADFTMDDSGEKFTVTYEGATSGQYLILMVAEGADGNYTINDDSIMYVNQDAGSEDGVTFTVYPTKMVNAKIMLGGGAGSPVTLGYLKTPAPTGFTVSGTVSGLNNTDDTVYLLYDAATTDKAIKEDLKSASPVAALEYSAETSSLTVNSGNNKRHDQTFSFAGVEEGSYKLVIYKKAHGLWIQTIDIEDDTAINDVALYILGDANRDGRVNAADALQVKQYSAGSRSFDSYQVSLGDVNWDNRVNAADALQIKQYSAGSRQWTR